MFVLEPSKRFIDTQKKSILTFIQSINLPMVAAADHPAEETQAFIITIQNVDRSLETYIYLHLQETNQSVLYAYDEAPFMGDRLDEAEGEALDFVESMGFMMDNMRINKISEEERRVIMEETPAFYADLKHFEPILEKKRAERHQEIISPDEEIVEEEKEEETFLEPQPFDFPTEDEFPSVAGLNEAQPEGELKTLRPEDIEIPPELDQKPPSDEEISLEVLEALDKIDKNDKEDKKELEETEDLTPYFEPKEVSPPKKSEDEPSDEKIAKEETIDLEPPTDESLITVEPLPEVSATQRISPTKDDLAALEEIEISLKSPAADSSQSITQDPPLEKAPSSLPSSDITTIPISKKDWQDLMRLLLAL